MVDREFVLQREKEHCKTLVREARKREANVTRNDRLIFIFCFEDDKIREKYLLTQDSLRLLELDARNSDQKEVSFHDLIVENFNDEDYIVIAEKVPKLHDDFSEQVVISKGDYTLSQEYDCTNEAKDFMKQVGW